MKVTVCQLNPNKATLDRTLAALSSHIKTHDSDFLLLPEMCFAPWLAADKEADAIRWKDAVRAHETYIEKLDQLGAKAALSTRPIVNAAHSHRNQAYLWSKDHPSASPIREKYYLPDEDGYYEHHWYDRGDKKFDIGRALDMRIGVQICTEMWFFEWSRHYANERVDLLCVPRATPHGSTDKWLAGGQAAAVCSGAYCLSSNLFAPAGDHANLGGLAWIIDPEGNILATTSEENPFATVEIDLAFAQASKSTYPRYVPE